MVAYGSHYTVVIVDPVQLKVVQTLDKHKAPIVKIKWPKRIHSNYVGNLSTTDENIPMVLASGDSYGQIVIWDVATSNALHVLSEGMKPIQDMMWIHRYDQSERYLLAIHPPHTVVVWDTISGTKLWKKVYTEQLIMMDIDPFDPIRLAFVCPDCILIVEDFSLAKAPTSNGRKFYISSPRATTPATPSFPSTSFTGGDRSRDRLRRLMRDIIVGEAAPRPEEQIVTSLNECLQLSFHRCLRHIICLVYAREILLVDLRIQHTVSVLAAADRNYSPFQQLLLCRQRDVLICVHETGSLSGRLRRPAMQQPAEALNPPQSPWNSPELEVELHYDQKCQTESIRLTKSNKILAAALHPMLESHIVLLLSDGRLYFYHFGSDRLKQEESLYDMFPPLWTDVKPVTPLKFSLCGLVIPLMSAATTVIKMCPPLTLKNLQAYQPLVAIGCPNGAVHIVDVADGMLKKEIAVHNYPVKGIEWTLLEEFLSYGQSPVANGGLVRNELIHTNVATGKTVAVRADRGEESPIEMVRVSPLKQYFLVVFKDGPPELWNLRHLTLIRTLPRRFPVINSLEWLPSHLQRQIAKKTPNLDDSDSSGVLIPNLSVKEFFVFSDPDSNLYHLTVDGSIVKDGARLSPPNNLNGITSLAWKSEWVALGDAEGNVAIWEWRTRHFRPLPHTRSPIRKLRFAPGKNNMKLIVLHMDGVDIWDVRDSERLGQWKNTPFRDYISVVDVDWAASDRPLLACSDGTLRIFDLNLQQCSSRITESSTDPVVNPAIMPRSAFHAVKTALQLNLHVHPNAKDMVRNYLQDRSCRIDPAIKLTLPEQCLHAARRCGDVLQVDLWTTASFYLDYFANREPILRLDTVFDIYCDSATYRHMATERAALYQSKPRAYEHTRQLTRDHLLLSDKDKAIALLLNTEPEHDHFYSNHLLACLSAILDPTGCNGNAHSTLKLVATHLIASGHIWQGIEILILNGQVPDACRYLQANNLWEDSARVAKLLLMDRTNPEFCAKSANDATDIWIKWAHHLSQNRQKFPATLILTAVGAWHKAAELLIQQQMPDAAALLLRSAQQLGIYTPKDDAQLDFMEGTYVQYTKLLYNSGWHSSAEEWAAQCGSRGQQLLEEWKILNNPETRVIS